DGGWRGVCWWAVCWAMEQWQATQEGAGVRLNVSYGKLLETAQRLVSALWFDQTPELRGPAGLADLAVLHPGLAGHEGETHDRPHGAFKAQEPDPGIKDYLIYNLTQGAVTGGKVPVAHPTRGGCTAGNEYFYMTANVSMSSSLTISSGASQNWSNPPSGLGTLSFTMPQRPTWSSGTPSGTLLCHTNNLTGDKVCINWQMSESHSGV